MRLLQNRGELERFAGWALLALLVTGCVLVLMPFLSPILWAAILVFTTWPAFRMVEERLGHRTIPAALVMTLGLATALVLPVVLVGTSLADNVEDALRDLRAQIDSGPGPMEPPGFLAAIPLIGESLAAYWRQLATNTGQLVGVALPYLTPLRDAAVKSGLTIGRGVLELSLSVLITFFFYRDGPRAMDLVRRVSHKVAGRRALRLIDVAANTVRGVVYGVIGTALAQGALAAFGLWLAGIPAPFLLGILTFLLALFPVGAPFVWLPATLWLFHQGEIAWGIFMGIWGAAVISGVDNFLRPYLISKGSNMPFLLVFMGVIGGVFTFGILGIFLGPTLLALAAALTREWLLGVQEEEEHAAAAQIDPGRPSA
ncbi:MAG: AI-2E family transporter [Geminicoccaceae bacterium]|nr:AI-2E family transporter [Geminicoccaceae bacterium]